MGNNQKQDNSFIGIFNPKYVTSSGEKTTEDDPNRLIWYSAGCGYFTDNWHLLKSANGIPICPKCGCPGMQVEAEKWDEGVFKYDKGNPGYLAFCKNNKEKCMKQDGGFLKAFEKSKEKA